MKFDSEWGLRWPDKIFTPFYMFLGKKATDWPTWMRRLYLLSFPFCLPIIWFLKYMIFVVGILCMGVAFTMNYYYRVWHGK